MKSPPEFKDIKPGQILRILKAAYGLADAPLRWMARLARDLRKIGYEPCLLDPCRFMRYDNDGYLVGILSSHVDDLQVAAGDEELRRGQALLETVFGKLKAESQHYKHTGVWVHRISPSHIEINQEEYDAGVTVIPLESSRC